MRTEKEIRDALEACNKVATWDISNGPCPFNSEGEEGCCAECSMPGSLRWVLNDNDSNPSANGQDNLINAFKDT